MRVFMVLLLVCLASLSQAQSTVKKSFPYRDYKSVVLRMKKSGDYILNNKDITRLLNIINTPTNFKQGEPDMPNLDGKVEFRAINGSIVGSFTFDYYYGLLNFTPHNHLAKDGLLTEKANRAFFFLIKEITKGKL